MHDLVTKLSHLRDKLAGVVLLVSYNFGKLPSESGMRKVEVAAVSRPNGWLTVFQIRFSCARRIGHKRRKIGSSV